LKTAEANATAFMRATSALLKTERDNVEKYALSLHLGKDTTGRLLDNIDSGTPKSRPSLPGCCWRVPIFIAPTKTMSRFWSGIRRYKVVNGQFIFPFQRTVDRYNVAASAMTVASTRVAELEEERERLLKSQHRHGSSLSTVNDQTECPPWAMKGCARCDGNS